MPMFDPAFALGPFLQLPPYLPSGQALSIPNSQWYGKTAGQVPAVNADLVDRAARAANRTTGAAPGVTQEAMQPGLQNPSSMFRDMQGGKPALAELDHTSADGVEETSPVPAASSDASVALGSSTCSGSSVTEDASQEAETIESARSGLTSNAESENVRSCSHDSVAPVGGDSTALEPVSAGRLQIMMENDVLSDAKKIHTSVLEDVSAAIGSAESAKETQGVDGAASSWPHTYDSSWTDDMNSEVIDPEAPDPTAEELARLAALRSPESAPSPEKTAASSSQIQEEPVLPRLSAVLGNWWDDKGSYYEVFYDDGTTSTCYVQTTRPGGAVRGTKALIHIGQVKGRPAGRILWGSTFVLETPISDPRSLDWYSIRGGKDFKWTRAATQGDSRNTPSSPSNKGKTAHKEKDIASPAQNKNSKPDNTGGAWHPKGFAQKRVWRAVPETQTASAKSPAKTPSEVAASPCRRVKSHSGVVRIIKK